MLRLPLGPEQLHTARLPPSFDRKEATQWAQLIAHDYERQMLESFEEMTGESVNHKPAFEFVTLSLPDRAHPPPLLMFAPLFILSSQSGPDRSRPSWSGRPVDLQSSCPVRGRLALLCHRG